MYRKKFVDYMSRPKPMLVEDNTFMFIKPRVKFLVIIIDQEYFANLDQNDVNMCIEINESKN